jgi:tRNA(fMet)-specific endonuclease VapC
VLGELVAGVEASDTKQANQVRLRRALPELVLWPYDKAAAEEFGRIYAELKRKGRMIQQVDIMIAAIARTIGNCTVVTKDSDLKAIDGLDVVDWSDVD